MGSLSDDRHLALLLRLGRRLPGIAGPRQAAAELTDALGTLGLAVAVCAVRGDMAEVVAIHIPEGIRTWLPAATASRLVGMQLPLDGVETMRVSTRLRRPSYGLGGAADTLRGLSRDPVVIDALPPPGAETPILTVPVLAGDRVVALVSTWGGASSPDLAPVIEACAAMLAARWVADDDTLAAPASDHGRPRSTHGLHTALTSLLAGNAIAAAFQPIVRLHDGSVLGFEALARFPHHPRFADPEQLFSAAATVRLDSALDLTCLRAALRDASRLGDVDLFLNVVVATLFSRTGLRELQAAVDEAGVDPRSIVLEFSERQPVPDVSSLPRVAAELRSAGFRIAVDDAGAGHASMRVIAELRPEFIKVDRSLIQSVESDHARRALLLALLSFSGHIGARLIAEGIETARTHDTLVSLGVPYGQGWFHGRPVLTAPMIDHPDLEVVDTAWFANRISAGGRPARGVAISQPAPAADSEHLTAPRGSRRGLAHALTDVARALQSEHDPLRILGVMAGLMNRVIPVKEMCIFVAEYDTHQLVPVIATGPDREQLLANAFPLDVGITGWAFATGVAHNIANTSTHPLSRQVPGTSVIDESLLLIPLVAGEHRLGIINCWRPGVDRFTEHELEAASLFAHIAAAAWRNAQLYNELLTAAMSDPLTRLHNSRWLHDVGERDLARAARDHTPVAVLLIDLDHFKRVNDNSGHAAGDLTLQRVATQLRGTVRGADAVIRLGGEEFVALLYDCDVDGALAVAESMRAAVRSIIMPPGAGVQVLTASIGIAVYPDDGRDLDHLLAAADRAMYVAKRGGRDRVERSDGPVVADEGAAWAPATAAPMGVVDLTA